MKTGSQGTKNYEYSILYVDDEELARHYFGCLFENEFRIVTAESAGEALDILKTDHENFAIILTDQRMPVMSGTELLFKVQQLYPRLVKMLTTAYMDREPSADLAIYGKTLIKPWNAEEIRKVFKEAIATYSNQK